ncbi:hypothetical protein CFP56_019299 [Quercus suber]|uniref:Uncharacterized protein n=1 Tax=Quercus suber TaxID=58331 RepID=A0AAW0KJ93_QUESU
MKSTITKVFGIISST